MRLSRSPFARLLGLILVAVTVVAACGDDSKPSAAATTTAAGGAAELQAAELSLVAYSTPHAA